MHDLQGKNALLTGASRGLGVYIACELALQGINLVLTARPESIAQLEQEAGELESFGVSVLALPADLSVPAHRRRLVEQAQAELGPIDILINNAGVETIAPFLDCDNDTVATLTEINLIAPLDLARQLLPSMIEQHLGHIVNVASMAGKSPAPYNSIYSANKAGLIAWSWALRDELAGSGVSVSVVCPGNVAGVGMHARTQVKPPWVAREIPPEQVAQAVLMALKQDRLEVLVWPGPIRPLLAVRELSPNLARWFYRQFGINRFMLKKAIHGAKKTG